MNLCDYGIWTKLVKFCHKTKSLGPDIWIKNNPLIIYKDVDIFRQNFYRNGSYYKSFIRSFGDIYLARIYPDFTIKLQKHVDGPLRVYGPLRIFDYLFYRTGLRLTKHICRDGISYYYESAQITRDRFLELLALGKPPPPAQTTPI